MNELTIRMWRIQEADPVGVHMWFDPRDEAVKLYRIPHRDGEGAGGILEGVDSQGDSGYLDRVVSVSADGPEGRDAEQRFEQLSFLREEEQLPF